MIGRLLDSSIDFVMMLLQHLAVEHALLDQPLGISHQGIARSLRRPLGGSLVQPFVIGQRMRVGPHHVAWTRAGPCPDAAVSHCVAKLSWYEATKSVPSHFGYEQIRKARDDGGDAAARRLTFHRNRNRETVVLHENHQRQPFEAGDIDRLPEFAFAGGAFAGADQRYFVAAGIDVARGVRAPYRLYELRSRSETSP